MRNNDISSIPNDAFDGFSNLRLVVLVRNPIATFQIIDTPVRIAFLSLHSCELTEFRCEAVESLTMIKLNLGGNSLDDRLWNSLSCFESGLKRLVLENNKITTVDIGKLNILQSLEDIVLKNNSIKCFKAVGLI